MTRDLYKKIHFIPPVPASLHHIDPHEVEKLPSDYPLVYSTYCVSKELHDWVQKHFAFKVIVNYQIITGQTPIHKDTKYGREICWNYLITSGGKNVATRFWNDNATYLMDEIVLKDHVWYEIDVTVNHDVTHVRGHRLAITVWPAE